MSQFYTLVGAGSAHAASTAKVQALVLGTSAIALRIHRVRITQSTHKVSEMYKAELVRITADGSGGTATNVIKKKSANQASPTLTGRVAPTSDPTITSADATTPVAAFNWNSLAGGVWQANPAAGVMPIDVSPGTKGLALQITTPSGTTSFTPDIEIEVEEIGG